MYPPALSLTHHVPNSHSVCPLALLEWTLLTAQTCSRAKRIFNQCLLNDWVMVSPDDRWWEAPCLRTMPTASPKDALSLHPLHCTPFGGEDMHPHVTVSLQTRQAPEPTGETWEETSGPTDSRVNKRRRRGWQCRTTSSPGDSVLS